MAFNPSLCRWLRLHTPEKLNNKGFYFFISLAHSFNRPIQKSCYGTDR